MTVYLDSSVVLRHVMGQRDALKGWSDLDDVVSSVLLEVECLRTLHRVRLQSDVDDVLMGEWHDAVHQILASTKLVDVGRPVLSRASQPLPVVLRALDAIHLASALAWVNDGSRELTFATHDVALARAARSVGLPVIGV